MNKDLQKAKRRAEILAEMRESAIERLRLAEEHLAYVETEIIKLKQSPLILKSTPQ